MSTDVFFDLLNYVEPVACVAVIALICKRKLEKTFPLLVALLAVRSLASIVLLTVFHLCQRSVHVLTGRVAYKLYFYIYWTSYAVEAVLAFLAIYSLYRLAMAPLPGLQRLGILMFRWAGGIALVLALTVAFGPHTSGPASLARFVAQLSQTQSVLTLSMLLFVTLASKPMGLSVRSKIVGVSLGLGILAATDLAVASWMNHADMVSTVNILKGCASFLALATWGTYFALPEPKRRMIVLPTTSPFLRWNQISDVLGDAPGFVALGEVTADLLAPAEVEIMKRASRKMLAKRLAAS